ncbi:hypothetical protein AB1Y20_015750 [Prymnesium parvum]|uniref:Uncharacterized protein n=1 Tax=Prymnesium parvum TaxID=97485 RepID=A0AB34K1W8_PRYPA
MSGGGADAPSSPASMLEGLLERTNDDDQEATGRGGGEPTPNPPRRSPRKSPAGGEARRDRERDPVALYSHHVVFDKKLK